MLRVVGALVVSPSGSEVAIVAVTGTGNGDGTDTVMTVTIAMSTDTVLDPDPDRMIAIAIEGETRSDLTIDEEHHPVPGARIEGATMIVMNAIGDGNVTIRQIDVGTIDTVGETEIQNTIVGSDFMLIMGSFYMCLPYDFGCA